MNAVVSVRRWGKGVTLFMAKLVMFPSPPPLSQAPSEGETESQDEYHYQENNNSHSRQTRLLMSNLSQRNSHSRNSFYPGRSIPCAVFCNVNIINFSHESFSSNFIYAPLLPVLLSFLQSSGTSPSPFELHPTAFMVSVACSVSYYFSIAAKFLFPGFASQFGVLMSVFGSLSAATLISLTLHLPWWSILFILLFMAGFFKLLNKLHATYGNILITPSRTMQPILPL